MRRPFTLHTELDTYKYNLIEHRIEPRITQEFFHCTEDNRFVRKRVFELLAKLLPDKSVDTVVVEKSKTGPALQPTEQFYPRMLGYLLKFAIKEAPDGIGEVVVITDSLPVAKKRKAVEKALKQNLVKMLPGGTPYRVMHHASKAHYGLQIADYLNWAIFRKWEHEDTSSFEIIEHLVRSEFNIFRSGVRHYY